MWQSSRHIIVKNAYLGVWPHWHTKAHSFFNILNPTATLAPRPQCDMHWACHHVKRAHLRTQWCTSFQHSLTGNLKEIIVQCKKSSWGHVKYNRKQCINVSKQNSSPYTGFRLQNGTQFRLDCFTVKRCHRSFCTTFRIRSNISSLFM